MVSPAPIRILSLCAGVAGLDLGLAAALEHCGRNSRVVCHVEREASAAAFLAARMEEASLDRAPVWSDLRTFDGHPWRGVVDCLTAGYPCQPFSCAGLRLGHDDPRHLWPEVDRVIGETGPPLVFLENVAAHLRMGFSTVRRDLEGRGYHVQAGLFSAAEVGASHRRERLFILAHLPGKRSQRRRLSERPPRSSQTTADLDGTGPGLADADGKQDHQQLRGPGGPRQLPGRTMATGREAARPADGQSGDYDLARLHPVLDHAAGTRRDGARGGSATMHEGGECLPGAGCAPMVNAESLGRGQGRAEHEPDGRRDTAPGDGRPQSHADQRDCGARIGGSPAVQPQERGEPQQPRRDVGDATSDDQRRLEQRDRTGREISSGESSLLLSNANGHGQRAGGQREGEPPDAAPLGIGLGDTTGQGLEIGRGEPGDDGEEFAPNFGAGDMLFAPGPGDDRWPAILRTWAHLAPAVEPGVRVLADGAAVVVDQSRADQLRAAGNGVVPLCAAHAFVTLGRRAGIIR